MNTRWQRTMAKLERQKAELVRRIEAWPNEWLTSKSGPAEWSVLEVLDHVRKTELAVLHSCEQNLKSPTHSVTLDERAKTVALLAMMRLPVRLRVPEPVSFVLPDRVFSLQSVLNAWTTQRLNLRSFLSSLTPNDESVGAVFHPAAGWMDVRRAMSFLSVHLRHHEYQIQRIEENIRSIWGNGPTVCDLPRVAPHVSD